MLQKLGWGKEELDKRGPRNCFFFFFKQPKESEGFPSGSAVKNLPVMQETQETQVRSLGQEDPLEQGMATHFSFLAWRIPWTEEPGGYVHRVTKSWTLLSSRTHMHKGIRKTLLVPVPLKLRECVLHKYREICMWYFLAKISKNVKWTRLMLNNLSGEFLSAWFLLNSKLGS